MAVSRLISDFYANHRLQQVRSATLREKPVGIPEKLLQLIWYHQRLLRDKLRTLDGQTVRVLHPGFWNHEAGPDFQKAILTIGNETVSGDVEIEVCASGWRQHGHEKNPNFKRVVLHVIWDHEAHTPFSGPTLALKSVLDSPLEELRLWVGTDVAKKWPINLTGQCHAPLRELSEEQLDDLLRQAAYVRLQRKANEVEARARQSGWEQALWEGIFRALGYKQNRWPMQRLGELLPQFSREATHPLLWQAWLFGLSGLLPTEPKSRNEDPYLRSIWDCWWREQNAVSDWILPKSIWRFNGLRPANLPQRRLAAASHWLSQADFFPRLEQWFTAPDRKKETPQPSVLFKCLQVPEDPYWSWHWTFGSVQLSEPQPLIGPARLSEIAVNVLLPWFWSRARAGGNEELQRRAENFYFRWPASDDNAVLRLARQRLLGGHPSRFNTASAQQGLLQIVQDFCERSNSVCLDCQFPDLVRNWTVALNSGREQTLP